MGLPKKWIQYFFHERKRGLESLCLKGEIDSGIANFFTRGTPVVASCGPAGVNGSVKMVGFVPRKEFIEEYADKAFRYAYVKRPPDMRMAACILSREFYVEEKIDFNLIGGLEMGFKHSWVNIRATGKASLVFYTPPDESFEVRVDAEVHEDDVYKRFLNAFHDIFHYGGRKSSYPAYIFRIRELYDNSPVPGGFGRKIYP